MEDPKLKTLEVGIGHLRSKLESIWGYLTCEVTKEDEHIPRLVDRLSRDVVRCLRVADDIDREIHKLS